MHKFKWLVIFPSLFVFCFITGCVSTKVSPNAVTLNVKFSWKGVARCSSFSPKIFVSNIPRGTKFFHAKLKDFDAPNWNHGGGKVKNNGSGVIKRGALKSSYNGPCPPSGTHRYQFTVNAIDKDGVVIGIGKAIRKFP